MADPYQLDRLHERTRGNGSALLNAILSGPAGEVETLSRENQANQAFQRQKETMGLQALGMQTSLAVKKHESDLDRAERERTREFQQEMSESSMAFQMEMLDKKMDQEMFMFNAKFGGRRGGGRARAAPVEQAAAPATTDAARTMPSIGDITRSEIGGYPSDVQDKYVRQIIFNPDFTPAERKEVQETYIDMRKERKANEARVDAPAAGSRSLFGLHRGGLNLSSTP